MDDAVGHVSRSTKQRQTPTMTFDSVDANQSDDDVPVTYSISIEAVTTSKRSLTCTIATEPNTQPTTPSSPKGNDDSKSVEHVRRSSIRLPVTYSTSIHIPCRPSPVKTPISTVSPIQPSRHHYYHHHHYHHHYHPLTTSARSSIPIRSKSLPRNTSSSSSEPSSPDASSMRKAPSANVRSPLPLPTCSAALFNRFYPASAKPPRPYKSGQSDYSEVCRQQPPSKRSLLFKLLTSPVEKSGKARRHRTCLTRRRTDSSPAAPSRRAHYRE